jgi:ring-1,2-phenylacetyl-CoA epoxidase subunit PaaD
VSGTLGAVQPSLATQAVWALLREIPDPEIPVISICDLGIVRAVDDEAVTITPTYSGCPAIHAITESVRLALDAHGYAHLAVRTALTPAWTTDWITPQGRDQLRAYGIAPPHGTAAQAATQVIAFMPRSTGQGILAVACPHCGSRHTETLSQFGSTACKSLMRCLDCREPFDHFKPV